VSGGHTLFLGQGVYAMVTSESDCAFFTSPGRLRLGQLVAATALAPFMGIVAALRRLVNGLKPTRQAP